MFNKAYQICEFGMIKCESNVAFENSFEELHLPEASFNNLYNYILERQSISNEEVPFVLFSKKGRRQIKVRNYVGVIETTDGLILEILPKIHLNKKDDEVKETKRIFLKMLRHLKNSPFTNISSAHLTVLDNFPLLEVFISAFITEFEKLLTQGLRSDYVIFNENLPFLKGKLKVNQNIKSNYVNKGYFYCEFDNFSKNIPANRILKSAVEKLITITKNYKNNVALNKIIVHLNEFNSSTNIDRDFDLIKSKSRLFSKYNVLLEWSEIFLRNKGFANFKGDYVNIAILFPMERIFEDYIAYLFAKYSDGYKIKAQDKSYFLVERHINSGRFRLKPDLVVKNESVKSLIIDTKWKLIDQYSLSKNYNISQADMYQLYAYGKKYCKDSQPRLVLLYPGNIYFDRKLESFSYEGDLSLEVIPFNFNEDEKQQVFNILSLIQF